MPTKIEQVFSGERKDITSFAFPNSVMGIATTDPDIRQRTLTLVVCAWDDKTAEVMDLEVDEDAPEINDDMCVFEEAMTTIRTTNVLEHADKHTLELDDVELGHFKLVVSHLVTMAGN